MIMVLANSLCLDCGHNAQDQTTDDSALDSNAFALKGRRSHRVRRPAKPAEEGAAQPQSGIAAEAHGSAAPMPDTAADNPGKPKRFLKVRFCTLLLPLGLVIWLM